MARSLRRRLAAQAALLLIAGLPAQAQAPRAPAQPGERSQPVATQRAPNEAGTVPAVPSAPAAGSTPVAAGPTLPQTAPAPGGSGPAALAGPPNAAEPPGPPVPAAAPGKPKRPPPPPREMRVDRSDPRPTFAPETREATALAVEQYRRLDAAGGWPLLPGGTARLVWGSKGPAIVALKAHLAMTGDLSVEDVPGDYFGPLVAQAVQRFQARHGLRETGQVTGATLRAMNVPAGARLRQLEASLRRIEASPFAFGERHVVVNIPAAVVEAVEGGEVKRRFVAVVGKPERASPTVETRITNVNLNPTWTVPTSIIRKDLIPKMRADPLALAKMKIRMLDAAGQEIDPASIDWSTNRAVNYTLRQDPGAANSLGQVRIDMPNRLAVYLHDTPAKNLFAADERFHSSGCVRVEAVRDLAEWLLAPQEVDRAFIDQGIASGERHDIKLKRPVPVAWVYLTGWATRDGTVHFRDDVYGLDGEPEPARTAAMGARAAARAPAPAALSSGPAAPRDGRVTQPPRPARSPPPPAA